ncbi:MAG: LytTR family DNA-binding domain-containing protein [Flavobacteriales bacterium]|nr:LytTR family DNA-binding domain-containing protein [Flavobacteriales bacterium]
MIKAVLVDDELHCVESLALQLKKFNDRIKIEAQFSNPFKALEYLTENTPDLLFLDVEMPGLNGFDLLNKLPKAEMAVVFTTAYDEYAVKAFRFSAFDYLLKPIADEDIEACLKNVEKQKNKPPLYDHLDRLMEFISSPKVLPNKIGLPTGEGIEFVSYKEIIRVESDSNYSIVFFTSGNKLIVCRTLKEMEQLLNDFNFVRVHHSHIINPEYLQRFVRQDGGYVVMTDGSVISVSRSRKDDFLNKMSNL